MSSPKHSYFSITHTSHHSEHVLVQIWIQLRDYWITIRYWWENAMNWISLMVTVTSGSAKIAPLRRNKCDNFLQGSGETRCSMTSTPRPVLTFHPGKHTAGTNLTKEGRAEATQSQAKLLKPGTCVTAVHKSYLALDGLHRGWIMWNITEVLDCSYKKRKYLCSFRF